MLGIRLKMFREAANLSQEKLGEAVGRAQAEIMRWEKGQVRIPAQEIPGLATTLHVPILAFFLPDEATDLAIDWPLHIASRRLSPEGRACLLAFLQSLSPEIPGELTEPATSES